MPAAPQILPPNPPAPPDADAPVPPDVDPSSPPWSLRRPACPQGRVAPSLLLSPLLSSDLPLPALAESLNLSLDDLAAAFRSPESRETLAILAEIEESRTRFRAEQGRRTAIATLELVATSHADLTERRRAAAAILRIASSTLREQRTKPTPPDASPTSAPQPPRTQGLQTLGSPAPHSPIQNPQSKIQNPIPPATSSPSEITTAFLSACRSDAGVALAIGYAFNEAPDPADPETPEDFDDYADRFESEHADLLLGLKDFTIGEPEPVRAADLPPDLSEAIHLSAQVTTPAGRKAHLRFEFIKPRQGPHATHWRLGPIHYDAS